MKVSTVLLCDDIRQEVTGKHILIGVYHGGILVAKMPGIIPSLGLFAVVEGLPGGDHVVACVVRGPDREPIFQADMGVVINDPAEPAVIAVSGGPVTFRLAGEYRIEIGEPGATKTVKRFDVRLGTPADENSRPKARKRSRRPPTAVSE